MHWQILKNLGCTSFEIDSNKKAINFLEGFLKTIYHNDRMRQTSYLLENDIMTDEEWQIFLDIRWKDLAIPDVN